ncbi:unknown [Bacteroides sp. CAG:462]|jgi:hypothetical protein|nr:unknown [Bacteroides sp. CAG:462]
MFSMRHKQARRASCMFCLEDYIHAALSDPKITYWMLKKIKNM